MMKILGFFHVLASDWATHGTSQLQLSLFLDVSSPGKVCGPENDHYRAIRRNQAISFHCSWPQDFGWTPRQFWGFLKWREGVRTISVLLAEPWMGKLMGKIGEGVNHLFQKTLIWFHMSVYFCLGLSQLETSFSPMNMDLCPWVAALASDHQEPQFIQFCNALKDLASNCVQEFSEDRPHMANVQQTLRQLNRQILNR